MILKFIIPVLLILLALSCNSPVKRDLEAYPSVWFAPINDPNKPDREILPQEAKAGEVILSKRG